MHLAKKDGTRETLRRKGRKSGRKGLPNGSAEIAAAALLGTLVASEVDANLKNASAENTAAQPQAAGLRPEQDVTPEQSHEQADLDARRDMLRTVDRAVPDEVAGNEQAQDETAGVEITGADEATDAQLAALESMDIQGETLADGATGESSEQIQLAQAGAEDTTTDVAAADTGAAAESAQGATQSQSDQQETGGALSPGAQNAAIVAAAALGVIGIAAASDGGGGSTPVVVGGGPVGGLGRVVDGPTIGAVLFADKNGNGTREVNGTDGIAGNADDEQQAVSDGNGNFNLGTLAPGTRIVSDGGVDQFTGKPVGRMIAVVDSDGNTVVNPLTTLFASGVTSAQMAAMGFNITDPADIDVDAMLRSADPATRAAGEDLFTLQTQVQTILNAALALRQKTNPAEPADDAFQAIANAMAAEFAAGGDPNTLLTRLAARAINSTNAPEAEQNTVEAALNNVVSEIEQRFNDLDTTYRDPTGIGDDDAVAIDILAQTTLLEAIENGNTNVLNALATDTNLERLVAIIADEQQNPAQARVITDTEATALIQAGMVFEANDDITVTAEGTHMQNTLKDLQRLGADAIKADENTAAGEDPDLVIRLGRGAMTGALPQFTGAAEIQLDVEDGQVAEAAGAAVALGDANVDRIGADDGSLLLNASQAEAFVNNDVFFALDNDVTIGGVSDTELNTILAAIHAQGSAAAQSGIDHLDMADGSAGITETQAQELAAASIDFHTGDDVTVNAEGTQVSTSLKDLADIGADHVDADDAAAAGPGRDIVLNLGFAEADTPAGQADLLAFLENNFGSGVFTGATNPAVQLNVPDQATFDAIMHNDDIVDKLVDMGVDFVKVVGTNVEDDLNNP